MATGPAAATREAKDARRADYDAYIDTRLTKVRSNVKLRDVVSGLAQMAAGVIGFLFLIILIDHWVVDIGFIGRLLSALVLLSWCALLLTVRVAPAMFRSINPAYAAKVVEDSEPSLKQTLLNYVFFRKDRGALKEVVYRTVEREAVSGLSQVEVDSAVDQSPLIRRAIVVAALVSLLGVYTVVSPKSPMSTVVRVLSPWSSTARPARVRIREVRPGNAQVYFGRIIAVSARIDRLDDDDQALVVYSTADGRETDVQVDLRRDTETGRHMARLPAQGGVQGDLTYSLVAGDAKAGPYRIKVVAAPSMNIGKIEFDYPDYTGRQDTTVENEGDISAPEGTRVTIHAVTNEVIASAYVEFDPDLHKAEIGGRRAIVRDTIPMQHDQREASAAFTLSLKQDRRTPVRQEYRLRFVNEQQETNEDAIHYRIEVIPDLAPRVEILEPERRDITLPENGQQVVQVRALDPDYELTSLEAHFVAGGRELVVESLLDKPEVGQVVREVVFVPAQFGLHAGDIVMAWATAADNRTHPISGSPAPNTERTDRYTIRIGEPAQREMRDRDPNATSGRKSPPQRDGDRKNQRQQKDPAQDGADQAAEDGGDPNAGEDAPRQSPRRRGDEFDRGPGQFREAGDENDSRRDELGNEQSNDPDQPGGDRGTGEGRDDGDTQANGESGASDGDQDQQSPVASDGSNDGDAFERILERMKETGAGDGQPNGDQQQSGQQQSGEQQSGQQQSGEQQSGEQQSGEQQSGQQQSGQQQSGQQQSGQQQSGQQQSGQQQSGQQQSGEQQSGEQQSGEQQSGEQQSGEQQSGEQQSGEQQSGEQRSGQQQSGQQQSGQQQSGQQQSGQQQSGEQQSGEQQSGEQQSGEQQSGEQQSGEQQSGEQQSGEQRSGQQQSGQQQSGQQQSGQQQSGQQQSGQQSDQQQSGQQQPSQDTESGSQGKTPKGSSRTRSPGGAQGSANQQGGQQGNQPQDGSGQTGSGGQGATNSGGSGSSSTSEEVGGQQQSGSQEGRQGSRRSGSEGSSASQSTSSSSNGTGQGSSSANGQGSAQPSDSAREGSRQNQEERSGRDGETEGQGERGEREGSREGGERRGDGQRGNEQRGSNGEGRGGEGAGEGGEQGGSKAARRQRSDRETGGERSGQGEERAEEGGAREDSERGSGEQGAGSGENAGGGQGESGADGRESGQQPGESSDQAAQLEGGEQQGGEQQGGEQQGGEKEGGNRGEQQSGGRPGESESSGGQGEGDSASANQGTAGGMPGGGGAPADGDDQRIFPNNEDEPGGDAVNEDFARRATDMALEYLKHQENNPDQELLDRLGWSPDDLNAFVRRWEQLKRNAADGGNPGDNGQLELDEALRSLGLAPGSDRVRKASSRNDAAGGVTDAGTRSRPPAEYLERYKAYLKSSSPE